MRLADYLAAHGITQAEFSRRASLTTATVSRLVTGKQNPGTRVLNRISGATGGQVGYADFFEPET